MYTVKEVSDLLNVSTVTVYNKLKKFKIQIKDQKEKNFIDDNLFKLLKGDLQINKTFNKEEKQENILKDIDYINLLREQIDFERNYNKEQLINKEKEIERLHELLKESNKLVENNQVLLREDRGLNYLRLAERVEEVDRKMELARENMKIKKNKKKKRFSLLKSESTA